MAENKQFDADSNDCGNHFDYSLLLSRYEADVERNEIIEYNKHKDNAQYRSLDMIAGELNFKQLQIEGCRKACENLIEENERLKETLAYRSNQIALLEELIEDSKNDKLISQMKEVLE